MSDEQNTKHDALVPLGERGLITPQSAKLAKRGLDLFATLHGRMIRFPPRRLNHFTLGMLEMRDIGDCHEWGTSLGVAEGIITLPPGKELILEVQDTCFAQLLTLQPDDIQVLRF